MLYLQGTANPAVIQSPVVWVNKTKCTTTRFYLHINSSHYLNVQIHRVEYSRKIAIQNNTFNFDPYEVFNNIIEVSIGLPVVAYPVTMTWTLSKHPTDAFDYTSNEMPEVYMFTIKETDTACTSMVFFSYLCF